MKTKVAFIGPKVVYEAFETVNANWDFQTPLESLQAFSDAYNEGKISDETAVIIMLSTLYDTDPTGFAQLAAFYSPYTAILVLDAHQGQDTAEIRSAIKAEQAVLAEDDPDFNAKAPFYIMNYENYPNDYGTAIVQYIRNSNANESAVEAIRQSLSDEVADTLRQQAIDEEAFERDEDDYDFDDDDDRVVIPEASEGATGKVITVTSSKGGSGKSTVSLLLSSYLSLGSQKAYEEGKADRPLKVLVFDFDTRDGQLGFLNGRISPTVVDIVAAGDFDDESLDRGIWHNPSNGVDFIFAAKRPRHAAQIPNSFFANAIQRLRERYDYIILDTSVNYLDPLLDSVAYPIADKIIFVSDLGISSIFGMKRWLTETTQSDEPEHENINPNKIGIVINKVMKNVNMDLDKIQQSADNTDIYALIPSKPSLITYAANTAHVEQVLNFPPINSAILNLAKQVTQFPDTPDGYPLSEVSNIGLNK